MEMDIYGFRSKVTRDGKHLIGEIPELHVVDQSDSLKDLESELKDAVTLVVEFIIKDPKHATKSFGPSVIRKLNLQVVKA